MTEYVEQLVAEGSYPQVEALIAENWGWSSCGARSSELFTDPDRFLRNIHRLLDGIERSLPS